MSCRALQVCMLFTGITFATTNAAAAPMGAAREYDKHFEALTKLSIAVAQAMPAEQYGFKPHPESMAFGELMSRIAATNYQFCAALKDTNPPELPSPTDRDAIIRFLSDSFSYCSAIISSATRQQMISMHDSPDGRLTRREVLLAMFVHVAHHRGQAEVYLATSSMMLGTWRLSPGSRPIESTKSGVRACRLEAGATKGAIATLLSATQLNSTDQARASNNYRAHTLYR